MALPPKFAGHLLIPYSSGLAASSQHRHTLELYLDYICPFSEKLFKTFYTQVLPLLTGNSRLAGRLQVVFRHQVQPWHPSSTLVHEAAVAVLRVDGGKFWKFSEALFAESRSFYDISVVSETRNQTYARLAAIAGKVGVSESEILKLLTIMDKPGKDGSLNVGNGTTNDMKLLIKMARLSGVHVSPTVLWDGIVESSISSSWTSEQWMQWLEYNI